MKNHIPSFDEFLNESMSFEDLKKFEKNPYGIGASSVEFEEGSHNNGDRLIFRCEDKYRRDEIEKKLKTMGISPKKMSKSTADKAYSYRYELTVFENESPIFESVYPERNGQLNSYDKKYFTEVGRKVVNIGKDVAAIFLFGYSVRNWRGTDEFVAEITCTSYSIDVKNLGNSNGSIISSETFGTEEDAKAASENHFKTFKLK